MHTDNDSIWNLTEMIEWQARRHPAAPAIILRDRIITHRELFDAVHAIARKLLDSGIKPGQAIGMSILQTPLHLSALLAIARIGAISVPAPPGLSEQQRLQIARQFNVQTLVSGRAEFQLKELPFIDLGQLNLTAPTTPLAPSGSSPDDPCRIAISSGTSGGEPKGVMYTHGYLRDLIREMSRVTPPPPYSRLMPMDLNFSAGFVNALWILSEAGAVVLGNSNSPGDMAYMVRSHAVTHWVLSPGMAGEVAKMLVDADIHFPSLTHLRILGATPGKRLLDTLFTRFSRNVFECYGCSEIGDVSMATPEILRSTPTSAGRILPWLTAEIVDNDNRPLTAGTSGRLRIKARGRIMTDGYFGAPDLTTERFRDGWYYPRDRARIDADGLLYIEGREDDVINIGGQKIYPQDIECVLQSHPAVREAAVFALCDATEDGVLAAAFTPTMPISVGELHTWAQSQLGALCPRQLFQVNDFPRTATGKIKRDELLFRIEASQAS